MTKPNWHREKCSYANSYQAQFKPTCGCKVCWDAWTAAQLAKNHVLTEMEVAALEEENGLTRKEIKARLSNGKDD